MGNIHVKLYEIWTSGLDKMSFKKKRLRTDGRMHGFTDQNS